MITEAAKFVITDQIRNGNTNWTQISREVENSTGIKLHRSTIQRWYDREGQWGVDDTPSGEVEGLDERVKLDKKIATLEGETKLYKNLYKKAIAKSASTDLVIKAIKDATEGLPPVKVQKTKKVTAKKKATHPQTMVCPLSDTHVGDRVLIEEMNGLNQYNIDIFGRRLYGWTSQIIDLAELRRNYVEIPHLVVPMLGDMISGDIHDELARTNIDNCMNQMIIGAYMISQALIRLSGEFEDVYVPAVVGNHGRMTKRVPGKDRNMDWDYMLYQWVASFCKNQPNIKFHIPKSPFTIFPAAGHNILIMHGDSVPGGGSSASMMGVVHKMRTVLQFKETAAVEQLPADLVESRFEATMMGHFHRVDEFDVGTGQIFVVGTMKGGDEYATNRIHLLTEPKQIATYWHPVYGYIGKEIIYLGKYDNAEETFDNVTEGVWANG